jgi:hypothetical protein
MASRKSVEAKKRQIQRSKQNRETETLKLKVVFSLETGIIDTGSFGFRKEGSPTDRRSASVTCKSKPFHSAVVAPHVM